MEATPSPHYRTIICCNGIGDNIWLFQKLIHLKEKFHWKIGDGIPQRGHQLFELFPQLTASFEYIPKTGYNKVKRNSYQGKWSKTPDTFYLEANGHLEAGKRIETFLPDLPTTFILPYATTIKDVKRAKELLPRKKYIGIYTTSYNNARHMSGWLEDQWFEFISLIRKYNPSYTFVFIGAHYDKGVSQNVMARMKTGFINTIGEDEGSDTLLPTVIEILKRLDCFVGFQSGLSIINETIGAKSTVMFYADALEKMINTWADPKRIEDGTYKGCRFCRPQQIFEWMIENKKL